MEVLNLLLVVLIVVIAGLLVVALAFRTNLKKYDLDIKRNPTPNADFERAISWKKRIGSWHAGRLAIVDDRLIIKRTENVFDAKIKDLEFEFISQYGWALGGGGGLYIKRNGELYWIRLFPPTDLKKFIHTGDAYSKMEEVIKSINGRGFQKS